MNGRRSLNHLPSGTLVHIKPLKWDGVTYRKQDGAVWFYATWGIPNLDSRREVSVYRNQSCASSFRPLRLYLPWAKGRCKDGREVLLNKDRVPLWIKNLDGSINAVPTDTKLACYIDDNDYFFDRWYSKNRKDFPLSLAALRAWGVEDSVSHLMESFPAAIASGDVESLTKNTIELLFRHAEEGAPASSIPKPSRWSRAAQTA